MQAGLKGWLELGLRGGEGKSLKEIKQHGGVGPGAEGSVYAVGRTKVLIASKNSLHARYFALFKFLNDLVRWCVGQSSPKNRTNRTFVSQLRLT